MSIKRALRYEPDEDVYYLENQKGLVLPCKKVSPLLKPGNISGQVHYEIAPCCSACPYFDTNEEGNVIITCAAQPVLIEVDRSISSPKTILAKA